MQPAALTAAKLEAPPDFVRLVAHPLRWRLLRELTQSDRAVWELAERVGEPQNLVSYHLRQLRDGGLVSARRSAADGRGSYYAIDLAQCERQLQAAGGALHPALLLVPATAAPACAPLARTGRRPRVLFLCTGNSARSQIAEALLEHMSGGRVEVASAGSHPKPLHPEAIRVMRARGIDISANRTKHVNEVVTQRFDLVITLCDRVREVCPEFPSHPRLVHWSVPDPVAVAAAAVAGAAAGADSLDPGLPFERTAADLESRIRFLLPLLVEPSTTQTTRRSSHAEH